MELVKAGDLMRRDLAAVMLNDPVGTVMRFLHRRALSGVPVVDDHWHLKGFFSQYDVVKLVMPTPFEVLGQETFLFDDQRSLVRRFALLADKPVSDFMNHEPVYVTPDTPLMDVVELLVQRRVRRMPVVEKELLVGTVGQDDLLEYLQGHFDDPVD